MTKRLIVLLCVAVLAACGGDDSDPGVSAPSVAMASPPPAAPEVPGNPASPGIGTGTAPGNKAPTIAGSPPEQVLQASLYEFRPSAGDEDGDSIEFYIVNQPPWSHFDRTTGRLHGTPSSTDLGTWSNIEIGVSDGSAAANLPLFAITVQPAPQEGAVLVGWNPPTENIDDSPLTDLAGYNIYWGTDPIALTENVTIAEPGVTSHLVENLGAGTYYFAVTAFNEQYIESELSQSVVTVVN
jgi:hypothetical protein